MRLSDILDRLYHLVYQRILKEPHVRDYVSSTEWIAIRRHWRHKYPIRSRIAYVLDILLLIPHEIKMKVFEVKCFIQRGRRGWSDRDWWDASDYLCNVIIGCLSSLKERGTGYPIECKSVEEWHTILDKIISSFKTAKRIINGEHLYIPTYDKNHVQKRKKAKQALKEMSDTKVMSAKECKQYEEGLQLFVKYFLKLWD